MEGEQDKILLTNMPQTDYKPAGTPCGLPVDSYTETRAPHRGASNIVVPTSDQDELGLSHLR